MWKELFSLASSNNLFVEAHEQAADMLDTDWIMYQASVESLRNSDTGEIEIDIYAKDKEVNRAERDIRRKIFTHLCVSGSTNLSAGLALVTVVIDIERIGDYTKNIYDLARCHPQRLHAGSLEEKLKAAEAGITDLFKNMITSYKNDDVELARKVMLDYKGSLSAACGEIGNAIVRGEADDLNAADAGAVALYARFLKRIASHSRNIISGVVNPFPRIGYKEKKEEA